MIAFIVIWHYVKIKEMCQVRAQPRFESQLCLQLAWWLVVLQFKPQRLVSRSDTCSSLHRQIELVEHTLQIHEPLVLSNDFFDVCKNLVYYISVYM